MNKRAIDIQRDAAMSIGLPQNCGKVEEMHDINGHLYVMATNGIYEIILPDAIDPERKNPDIKPVIKEVLDVGFSEPFVSRILGQVFEFSSILSQSVLYDMLVIAFDIIMEINQMVETLMELDAQTIDVIKKIDTHNKENRSLHIGQVSGLDFKVKAFFLEGHKVLKQVLQLLSKASDIDGRISFTELVKCTNNNNVKKIIEGHREVTIEFIWELRNAIEHPSNNQFIKIDNICISANNKIMPPIWNWSYLSWSKDIITSKTNASLLGDMDIIICNLLTLIEDALLCLALHKAYCIIPFDIKYNKNGDKYRYSIEYKVPNMKIVH